MIKRDEKKKVLEKAHRFEVRCRPELRQLADEIQRIEGDATFSQSFRKMVLARAGTVRRHIVASRETLNRFDALVERVAQTGDE